MKMEEEMEINGKKYVLKSSIKECKPIIKNKKGLTFCVIRTYSAGVFAGWVDRKIKGKELTIYGGRRLWYWSTTGLDCSSIAEKGIIAENCKFSEIREEIDVKEVIELQPCSKGVMEQILAVESAVNDK